MLENKEKAWNDHFLLLDIAFLFASTFLIGRFQLGFFSSCSFSE